MVDSIFLFFYCFIYTFPILQTLQIWALEMSHANFLFYTKLFMWSRKCNLCTLTLVKKILTLTRNGRSYQIFFYNIVYLIKMHHIQFRKVKLHFAVYLVILITIGKNFAWRLHFDPRCPMFFCISIAYEDRWLS